MPMCVGIAGPIDLGSLHDLLDGPLPRTRGHSAPIISSLIRGLIERGHDVVAFTVSLDQRDVGTYRGEHLIIEVGPNRLRKRWVDVFREERRVLRRAIENSRCDIVHAHWTYEYAMAALESEIPSLITVRDWGPEVLRYQRHPYRVVRLGMQWHVLRKAATLSANSPYIAEKIRKWYRRDVPVVPNGITVPDQLPSRRICPHRSIGSVNNGFGKRKNVQALLEAFALMRCSEPDLLLRLAGVGYQPAGPADEWARSRGLDVGVEFVGPIPSSQIPAFMRSIDLLVHPSLEESFGMTLVEAIIQGTLVIGGRSSGAVPWVLGAGKAGTLVDVANPGAICQAVLEVARDPAELNNRRQRALGHVRNEFSLGRVVDGYEELYRDILAGSVLDAL